MKDKIIQTAFYLFLEHGYAATSMKDIMTASSLSKGAIYHHFDSKWDIYLATLDIFFFQMLNASIPNDTELDFRTRVKARYALFCRLFDLIEHNEHQPLNFPIRSFFLYQLESERSEEIRQKIEESMKRYRKEMQAIVQQAIDQKEISAVLPARVIAIQIQTMIEGIAIHYSTIEKNSKRYLLKKYNEVIGSYLDVIR